MRPSQGLGHAGPQAVLEVVEAAHVIAMTLDRDGRITYCNRFLAELSGWDLEELVGSEYFPLLEPHQPPGAIVEHLAHVAAGDPGPYAVTVLRTRSGDERVVSWSDTLVRGDDGEMLGVISIGQDITARVRSEEDLRSLAEEQGALHRVASLIAQDGAPDRVFAIVTEEVATLLGAQTANMVRYEGGLEATVMAGWSTPDSGSVSAGATVVMDGDTALTRVFRTGAPARVDTYDGIEGELAARLRRIGVRASVAAPIIVEGRPWGAVTASMTEPRPFPADAERRLGAFAKLAAQGIANAEARQQLKASRARIVRAADNTRRRIERDLHDGAQQRLVGLALSLRLASAGVDDPARTRELLAACSTDLALALEELRELARGIHPAMLTERGLRPALEAIADRSPIPVPIADELGQRLPATHEAALYFVASEALANVAKYAQATIASIRVWREAGTAMIEVRDDGRGGADPSAGSGLRGLADRVEALGGWLALTSPEGGGTTLLGAIPLPADSDVLEAPPADGPMPPSRTPKPPQMRGFR